MGRKSTTKFLPFAVKMDASIESAVPREKDVLCSTSKMYRNTIEMNVYKILHKLIVSQTDTSRVVRFGQWKTDYLFEMLIGGC